MSPFPFGMADMSKRSHQNVAPEKPDSSPLQAASLVFHMSENKLMKLIRKYHISGEFQCYVPTSKCRAHEPPPGSIAFSEHILKVGGTIPLHLFFDEVLKYFRLAPL